MCASKKHSQLKKTLAGDSGLLERTPPLMPGIVSTDPARASYMTYAEQLKSPKWQKKRLEILERDKFTCRICGDKEKELHVHHRIYKKNLKMWEYEDYILLTLCSDCHESMHSAYIDAQFMTSMFIEDHGFDSFKKLVLLFQSIVSKK